MNEVQQRSCQEGTADGRISLHPHRPEVAQLKLNADWVVSRPATQRRATRANRSGKRRDCRRPVRHALPLGRLHPASCMHGMAVEVGPRGRRDRNDRGDVLRFRREAGPPTAPVITHGDGRRVPTLLTTFRDEEHQFAEPIDPGDGGASRMWPSGPMRAPTCARFVSAHTRSSWFEPYAFPHLPIDGNAQNP
jgi:hypothetical protein